MIRGVWTQGVGGAHLLCVYTCIPARRRRIRHPGPCPDGVRHQGQERGRGAARGTGASGWALRAPMNGANPGPPPATGFRRLPWSPTRHLDVVGQWSDHPAPLPAVPAVMGCPDRPAQAAPTKTATQDEQGAGGGHRLFLPCLRRDAPRCRFRGHFRPGFRHRPRAGAQIRPTMRHGRCRQATSPR